MFGLGWKQLRNGSLCFGSIRPSVNVCVCGDNVTSILNQSRWSGSIHELVRSKSSDPFPLKIVGFCLFHGLSRHFGPWNCDVHYSLPAITGPQKSQSPPTSRTWSSGGQFQLPMGQRCCVFQNEQVLCAIFHQYVCPNSLRSLPHSSHRAEVWEEWQSKKLRCRPHFNGSLAGQWLTRDTKRIQTGFKTYPLVI